jgi:hypothetical protein
MLVTILIMQLLIGQRKLGRRDQNAAILQEKFWDNEKSRSKI